MSWASRAAKNLLPLSQDQSDLAMALREWRYTGDFHDLESPSASCELCDHPEIRYQFHIQNLWTDVGLLIGSECINRFGIAATDEEGRTLDTAGTRKMVARDRRKLVDGARERRVIAALVALAHAEQDFKIDSFIDYLRTRGAFTPIQLATLLWRLSKRRIPHNPKDFKTTIKRNREKTQLRALKDWQLRLVMPTLSDSQKAFLAKPGALSDWDDE